MLKLLCIINGSLIIVWLLIGFINFIYLLCKAKVSNPFSDCENFKFFIDVFILFLRLGPINNITGALKRNIKLINAE